MKQIIYSFLLGCLVLTACKKNDPIIKTGDKTTHKVFFNVGFSAQTAKFNTNATTRLKASSFALNNADTALTNHISVLIYSVYNSSGILVQQTTQSSTDASFGSYSAGLLPGNYTVCIAGGNPQLNVGLLTNDNNLNNTFLTTNNVNYRLFQYDTFFQKIALSVTNTDQTQNIVLHRITSLLKIIIKDAIPANVKLLNIYISGAADWFYYGTEKPSRVENFDESTYSLSDTIQTGDVGKTDLTFNQMLLYSAPLTVTIEASSTFNIYNPGDIAKKVITNVICQPNAETILSGNLFGGSGTDVTNGFAITIDTTYSNTPIIKTFP